MLTNIIIQILTGIGFFLFFIDVIYIIIYKKKHNGGLASNQIMYKPSKKRIIAVVGIFCINIFLVFCFLNIFLYEYLNRFFLEIKLDGISEPFRLIGFSIVIFGDIILFISYRELGTSWSYPIDGWDKKKRLVITGPYSKVRHPIYLAFNIISIGFIFLLLNWIIIILYICGAIGFYFQALTEEEILMKYYKEEYFNYMKNTGRFFIKKFMIPVSYVVIMSLFTIGSYVVNLPVLALISVYALTITTITIQKNHWVLNSISIPFTFIYTFALIQDLLDFNALFAIFHIPTVICCYIVIQRQNKSLVLMVLMSIVYTLWIYSIKTWVYFPFYECVFFICDKMTQVIAIFILAILASLLSSHNKIKSKLFKMIKKSNLTNKKKEDL